MNTQIRLGFLCSLGCYLIWGVLPLYFRTVDHIVPPAVLAHRIIWSVPTALVFILIASNWSQIRAVLTVRRMLLLSLSALLIGTNWLIYIYAVDQERVMEASLGYYINPLANVVLGGIVFKERLRRVQWLAFAIAALGVLIMTVAYGNFPWLALSLGLSFALYGVIRKLVIVDSRVGFLMETMILLPFAIIGLLILTSSNAPAEMTGAGSIGLLMLAGPITAVPLILFGVAAKRLQLSTIGMMQYIAPTLQFLVAVLIFKEPFGDDDLVAFAAIWTALLIYSTDSVMHEQKLRRTQAPTPS
ncbi:MAG: EamA family transporter RarD [Henriciella sp.]